MTLILDIRGTHGSGKSYVAHSLLNKYKKTKEAINGFCEYKKKEMVIGYHLSGIDAAVVGRYSNVCGGCDGIGSADETCRRVRLFSSAYSVVLFEGILVAHTFQRYSDLARELEEQGHTYKFLFLSTPLPICISRIKRRRKQAGNTKPFNPKNCVKDYHTIWHKVRHKCGDAGHTVIELDWRDPMPQVYKEIDVHAYPF